MIPEGNMKLRKDDRARTVRIDLLEGHPVGILPTDVAPQPHRDPCRRTMRIVLTLEVVEE